MLQSGEPVGSLYKRMIRTVGRIRSRSNSPSAGDRIVYECFLRALICWPRDNIIGLSGRIGDAQVLTFAAFFRFLAKTISGLVEDGLGWLANLDTENVQIEVEDRAGIFEEPILVTAGQCRGLRLLSVRTQFGRDFHA